MNYDEFVIKWNGKKADWDGHFAGQCVDLFRYYCDEVLEIPQPDGVFGAANFWYDFYTDPILYQNFERITNTDTFIPQKGDVGVWDWGISGGFGHIGMCNGEGNTLWFKSFDQNWRTLSVSEMITHTYNKFLGVLRPKEGGDGGMVQVPNDQFEELVRKSTEYDKFVAAGYNSVDDVNSKVSALQADLNNCQRHSNELQQQLEACQANNGGGGDDPEWAPNGKSITTITGNVTTTVNYERK